MASRVHFDCFEVDLDSGQLYKRGARVRLREKSFQVLASLLEHPGEVVTREELQRRLWREEVFVDFDNNLNAAIARLREALSDSAEHPRFIETLPKHGYRFLASVAETPGRAARIPTPRTRLVVLPFVNLGEDPSEEYFSDAMTDEVITGLANLAPESLAVIARTTAMHYKGSHKDIARIGRELSVDYVLEGSVRQAGGRIVANIQLIRVADQMHLWAKRYEVEGRDLFGMENALVQVVATQLGIACEPVAKKPTEDLQAYNLYILGRHHIYRGTAADMAKARQCFQEAITRDPKFALAHDGLGELYFYMGFYGIAPPKDAFSAGAFEALCALEIDGTLGETHALAGMLRKDLDYNWREAQRHMERARQLSPTSPLVRLRYAVSWLMPLGRIEEATAEMEAALEADPLSPLMRIWLATMLWFGRQYDRALEQARMLLELAPDYYWSHAAAGMFYREKRMFDEAIEAHCRAVELSGGLPLMLGWFGLALGQAGKTDEARGVLERLQGIATKAYVLPTCFAWTYLGLGEIDNAFEWMDRAIDARDHMMTPIKTYAFLDPLRGDPRFAALLRKMNLED
jgi:TolB-like protein/Tfp pilus assembly protein PilF